MTQENAYRDHEAMLELAIKATGVGPKKALRQQIEIQVVGMLIEAALKERNHVFAIQQSDRLMDLMKISGAVDMTADGSPKVKRVVKSTSFNSTTGAEEDPRADSPTTSQPGSRSGTSMSMRSKQPHGSPNFADTDPEARKPWEIFVQVGNESAGRDYNRRLTVVGYALACCPPEKLESVLELWRSLEMESLHAPVPEIDPRRGVAGFMSTMMDRTSSSGSGGPSGSTGSLGYNHGGRGGDGPLSEIIGRASTGSMLGVAHQDAIRRDQSMSQNNTHHEPETGRRRDKLKSLVSSIWSA